jgi:hypothetical protein
MKFSERQLESRDIQIDMVRRKKSHPKLSRRAVKQGSERAWGFLNLLKGEPEATGQLHLRDACFPATQTDSPSHLDVRVPGRPWAELARTRLRFGLAHGSALLHLAISDSGPRQFPSYLFFAFMKTHERCRATWNLRAMSPGPERAAAMKKAGILRKAADSHGTIYAKRGRPRKPMSIASGVKNLLTESRLRFCV